jgi:glycosyltransferase 2 family protein
LTDPDLESVADEAPERRGRGLGDWVRLAFLAVAIAFGVLFIVREWHKLGPVIADLNIWDALASLVFAIAGTCLSMLGWRAAIADVGAPMPLSGAARVFFVGQLGKYVPGSVWSFIAQAEMARDLHVSRKATFAGSMLGLALLLGSGLTVAAVFLPFGSHDAVHHYWWVVLVIPLFALALHPRIAGTVIDAGLRLIRRDPLEQRPGWLGILRAAGWYAAGWVVLGLHAWMLLLAVGAPVARSLPVAIGGFALAVCLGTLFIPAPAGVGVRDAAIVVAFGAVTSPAAALATARMSRVLLAILDFLLAGASALWYRGTDHRPPAVAT